MSLSINTNTASMAALQSLAETTSALDQTENRVSTGKDVSSASDNPAVYSIAQTMNSQIGVLSGVQSGLQFASQVVSTASQATTSISGILSSLSETITSAQTTGYDESTMNASLTQALSQIDSAAASATFQGVNLLAGATGNGVSYTSVSTAEDTSGNLYTQSGFNATAAGLGLEGLSVDQAGVNIDFGTDNTLDSSLTDGSSITLNNTAWGTAASASTTSGTATDPAISYDFVATTYTSAGMVQSGTTPVTDAVTSALGNVLQTGDTLSIGSTGALSVASTSGTTVTAGKTTSDGSTTYTISNGTTSDQVTVSQDASGNYTFSVASKFDANGNATAKTNIVGVDIGANDGAAGTDMITAMENAGFGVDQSSTGELTIAGNNLDAGDALDATAPTVAVSGLNTGVTATTSIASGSTTALLAVQAAITKMNSISSSLGAADNQISQLSSATSSLSSALTSGVGALTDADLASESAKLTSLQTKQQLAIQSLSIANSQSSTILSLFKG